jgi:hypothetical protein
MQHTEVLEEMLRAPLKTVVRRIGLERTGDGRKTELPRRKKDAIARVSGLKGLSK